VKLPERAGKSCESKNINKKWKNKESVRAKARKREAMRLCDRDRRNNGAGSAAIKMAHKFRTRST